jgi:hypothetical protein
LGFVIDPTAEWQANNIDTDPKIHTLLERFKNKIKSRMISFWTNADSLNGKVLAALSKQKNINPRPGWVRAENIPGPEVLAEVAVLSKEVARLSEENSALKQKASLEEKFSLIDAMADDADCQAVILMFETDKDIPPLTPYAYGYQNGGGGSGALGGDSRAKLISAGLIRFGGSRVWRLTDEGKLFAEWLIKKGRRCDFFWTPGGAWGDPDPNTRQGKWFLETKTQASSWLKTPPAP